MIIIHIKEGKRCFVYQCCSLEEVSPGCYVIDLPQGGGNALSRLSIAINQKKKIVYTWVRQINILKASL